MKKIRTGNDVHIVWTITKNDEISESLDALDLEGAEVLLIDSFNHPAAFEYSITTVDENTTQVTGTFFGKDQKTQGKYRMLLVKNKGEEGMITLDFVDAFILTCVSKFGVMSGNDESSITTATIQLESQFSTYNMIPDMTRYYTKEECENEFVHKSAQWAEDNPVGETIYGNKDFTGGTVEFNGYSVFLPDADLIYVEYGAKTLQEYVAEHGGGGGDLSNYYTKNETQNYVTSRIEDNTQNQSHSNTWSSYAIAEYVANALPQMSNYYTKNETQNYVTSRIEDNTQNQSHSNTWSSYAIAEYVRNSMPRYFGSVFDGYAENRAIQTKQYDITSAAYRRLFVFDNPDTDLRSQTGWCAGSIDITDENGTIDGHYSFLVKLNGNVCGWLQTQDIGTTASTRGLYQFVVRTPNAENNGSQWMVDIVCNGASVANPRHIVLKIYSMSQNCTIVANDDDVTYTNTTPTTITHNTNSLYYINQGGALQITAATANSALYTTNRETKYINTVLSSAGEAITTNTLVFCDTNNHYRMITNTSNPIDCENGVGVYTTTATNGQALNTAYYATKCGVTLNLTNVTSPTTWTVGENIWLQCTYPDSNGHIYSTKTLVTSKIPGYTYYLLGKTTATKGRISISTDGSQFMSINANGKLTHINGMELA